MIITYAQAKRRHLLDSKFIKKIETEASMIRTSIPLDYDNYFNTGLATAPVSVLRGIGNRTAVEIGSLLGKTGSPVSVAEFEHSKNISERNVQKFVSPARRGVVIGLHEKLQCK